MYDFSKQIEALMAKTDFAKIAAAMKAVDWSWHYTAPKTPTEVQVKGAADELLTYAAKRWNEVDPAKRDSEYWIGSGGFYVTINHIAETEQTNINLTFRLTDDTAYGVVGKPSVLT